MKRFGDVLNFVLGFVISLLLFSGLAFRKNDHGYHDDTRPQWIAPPIPEQISFAGEKVPIERWDVREKFDRELLVNYYDQGMMIYLMKLANKIFPLMSERLKANGIPDDFKYLCIAESNMQSWAVSKSGAVGYWQFLDGTGNGYGLETTTEVDQRQDLERSTDAACKYLRQAYAKFGNWTAAAASYNCGMGGFNSQASFQRTRNYYDLQLPEETNKYIFRILSFKYIFENAGELGFNLSDNEKYQPEAARNIVVNSSIADLTQFAIDQGTSYKIMRLMNPWLKGRSLTVKPGKSYVIKIPLQGLAGR